MNLAYVHLSHVHLIIILPCYITRVHICCLILKFQRETTYKFKINKLGQIAWCLFRLVYGLTLVVVWLTRCLVIWLLQSALGLFGCTHTMAQ